MASTRGVFFTAFCDFVSNDSDSDSDKTTRALEKHGHQHEGDDSWNGEISRKLRFRFIRSTTQHRCDRLQASRKLHAESSELGSSGCVLQLIRKLAINQRGPEAGQARCIASGAAPVLVFPVKASNAGLSLPSRSKIAMAGATQAGFPRLLEDAEDREANRRNGLQVDNAGGGISFPWLTLLGFLFLTFNSGMAIYRSLGDATAILFVCFSYGDLVLLFACLRTYERAPAGSSTRWWLKIAIWVLTTMLTMAFSYKVAAVMPPPVAVGVWLMAFATVAGGFVAFFLYNEKN